MGPQSGPPGIGRLGSQTRPGPPVASERTPRSQGEKPSSPLSRRTLEVGMGCWEERNVTQDSALQGVEGVLLLVELEPWTGTTEPEAGHLYGLAPGGALTPAPRLPQPAITDHTALTLYAPPLSPVSPQTASPCGSLEFC